MKMRFMSLVVVLSVALVLGACGKAEPTPEPVVPLEGAGLRGSLQGATALALGTLKLEGGEHAVTSEQAAKLLPLWKAIQAGSLQGAAETEAVLKQIEGTLDEGQLAAIERMELTFQDIQAWMEEQGVEMPAPPARPEGEQGGLGAFQNMTEEQRNQFRQELQNMTAEQRATRMAEMGFQVPEGGGQGGALGGPGGAPGGSGERPGGFRPRGGDDFLVGPLVELLTARASE